LKESVRDKKIMVIAAYTPISRKHTIENFLNDIASEFKSIVFLTRSNARFNLSKGVIPYIRPLPRLVVNKYIGILLFFADTLKLTLDCCKLIRKHKINLCLSFWTHWQAGLSLLLTRYICGTPYVLRIAGPLEIASLGRLGRTLIRRLSNTVLKHIVDNSALIILISQHLKNHINCEVSPRARALVIPYGIDTSLFRPDNFDPEILRKYEVPLDRRIILYAGRVIKQKGIDYLIDAAPKVLSRMKSVHFVVIGDGPDLKRIIKRAEKEGLRGHITFTGPVSNKEMPSFYNRCTLFLLPSLTEGIPRAALEAMACGVPVITTRLPWTRGLITHKENGYLIPPKDSNAIAKSIIELLSNEMSARNLGKSGRTRVLNKYDDARSGARSIARILKEV
jgi:glycosyltransferase involved in cell wall biosynthesis